MRATDTHGNVGNPTSHDVIIDSVPPTLTWKQGPPAVLNARNGLLARFDFQSNEIDIEGRETSTFQCLLERGLGSADSAGVQFENCGALPVVYSVRTGMYTFSVRPTDAAGNTGATYTRQFEVDATAPIAEVEAGYPGPYTRNGEIRLDFSQTEPGIFWCSMEVGDCIVNSTCSASSEDRDSSEGGSLLAAGYEVCSESVLVEAMPAVVAAGGVISDPPTMYRLRVLLEDLSGNLQDVPSVSVWTADTVAPQVTITDASKPFQLSARANPEIFFDVVDELAYRADIPVDPILVQPSDILPEDVVYSPPALPLERSTRHHCVHTRVYNSTHFFKALCRPHQLPHGTQNIIIILLLPCLRSERGTESHHRHKITKRANAAFRRCIGARKPLTSSTVNPACIAASTISSAFSTASGLTRASVLCKDIAVRLLRGELKVKKLVN